MSWRRRNSAMVDELTPGRRPGVSRPARASSSQVANTARSGALENSPAFPDTPPKPAALSARCTTRARRAWAADRGTPDCFRARPTPPRSPPGCWMGARGGCPRGASRTSSRARRGRGALGARIGDRRPVFERARPRRVRNLAAGCARGAADPGATPRGELIDHRRVPPSPGHSPGLLSRSRLGHTLSTLERGNPTLRARLRTYRVHRYVHLDGSGEGPLHYSADEPGEPYARQHQDPAGAPAGGRPRGECAAGTRSIGEGFESVLTSRL